MKNFSFWIVLIVGASLFVRCGKSPAADNAAKTDSTNVVVEDTSKTVVDEGRMSADFEVFAASFLKAVFWGKNIDSLVHASSPLVGSYLHKDFPFGRYWNEGVFCNIYHGEELGYHFEGNYHGTVQALNKNYPFFKEKMPDDGFCEEATTADGLYYQLVKKFPAYQDPSADEDPSREVQVAARFKDAPIMNLKVQVDRYIVKDIYFIQIENIWYLAYFYDCDCSA
jgi:hypothetical protein